MTREDLTILGRAFEQASRYQLGRVLALPNRPADLFEEIRSLLVEAAEDGYLQGGPQHVFRVLRLAPERNAIWCGPSQPNFRRDPHQPHLVRADGAWFDFRLILREKRREPLELLAYGFEFRRREPAWWVRFDLNPPDHDNEQDGLRCHIHVNDDDLQLPAPMLHPIELLTLFIRGLRPRDPDAPRQ
jgi:hypothetical protein